MSTRGLTTEAKTYVKFLVSRRHVAGTKFLIFGAGRSGSSLLVDLLDSHPQIRCEGEILHHRVLFPRLYVSCRAATAAQDAYGFKLLSYQLRQVQKMHDPGLFLQRLHESRWKIIYLVRRNILRRALSNLYARHRQKFHARRDERPTEAVRMPVDVSELLSWMEGMERLNRFEQQLLSDLPHLHIVYEDDLQDSHDHQPTVDRIFLYLGLPSARVKSNLVKATPRDLSDFVANHEELVQFVNDSLYSEYLEL